MTKDELIKLAVESGSYEGEPHRNVLDRAVLANIQAHIRNKHFIHISIGVWDNKYDFRFTDTRKLEGEDRVQALDYDSCYDYKEDFNSYEGALEQGIIDAFKLIEKRK